MTSLAVSFDGGGVFLWVGEGEVSSVGVDGVLVCGLPGSESLEPLVLWKPEFSIFHCLVYY